MIELGRACLAHDFHKHLVLLSVLLELVAHILTVSVWAVLEEVPPIIVEFLYPMSSPAIRWLDRSCCLLNHFFSHTQ
jgi:hypothetical protein